MTTTAIRMGDGHVVHSCGDCEVEVPMGSRTIAHRFYVMDTETFETFQDLRVLFRPVLRIFKPLILNLLQSHFENLETTPFL